MKLNFTKVFLVLSLAAGSTAFAQEKMTMEVYAVQLKAAQDREAAAKAALENCNSANSNINNEISEIDANITSTWNQIYALVGSDKAGVDAYRQQLLALEREVDGLGALSAEELFKRRKEIDDIESRLNDLKGSKIYALTEMQNKAATIEGKISALRNRMPKSLYDDYTVMRGDYLWKIAGKADIYGDPLQWIRIHSVNRAQIQDPDVIFPEQILKIQRGVGPDEYLVAKGDFLQKIAGQGDVLGDPTKWTKLYEANKDVVGDDPSLIYPYQVLRIPR